MAVTFAVVCTLVTLFRVWALCQVSHNAAISLTSIGLSSGAETKFVQALVELECASPRVATLVVQSSLVAVRDPLLVSRFPSYRFVAFQTIGKQPWWTPPWKQVGFISRSNECWAIEDHTGRCLRFVINDDFHRLGEFLVNAGIHIRSEQDASEVDKILKLLLPQSLTRGDAQQVSQTCWRLVQNMNSDWETYFEVTLDIDGRIIAGRFHSVHIP